MLCVHKTMCFHIINQLFMCKFLTSFPSLTCVPFQRCLTDFGFYVRLLRSLNCQRRMPSDCELCTAPDLFKVKLRWAKNLSISIKQAAFFVSFTLSVFIIQCIINKITKSMCIFHVCYHSRLQILIYLFLLFIDLLIFYSFILSY